MSHILRSSRFAGIGVMFVLATGTLAAQTSATTPPPSPDSSNHWELLFSTGKFIPTGAERRTLRDAPLSTVQLSYVFASRVALTTMFGWARSHDLGTEGTPRISVFTYDVGIEARTPRWNASESVSLASFAGIGGGRRSLDYRGRDVDATHAPAGYAAVGADLAVARVGVRLEARDYVASMTPLAGAGRRQMRNDLSILAGLRLLRKRPSGE